MSYLNVIADDGKTDEQRYDAFIECLKQEGVIEKVLEDTYDGEFNGLIQEQIAADMSPLGMAYDYENKELAIARHRAMLIRHGVDAQIRPLCKELDGKVKYELTEQDLAAIKELDLAEGEVEDEIIVRPFCLYEFDIKHVYDKDMSDLPEQAADFAKLALNHEMDVQYEDSDEEDGDWEDEEDEDEDSDEEEDEDEDSDEEDEDVEIDAKGKGAATEGDEDEDDKEEDEHVHGDNCCHGHDSGAINLDDEDLPFDEEDVTINSAETGLALLKDRREEVVEALEKIAGAKIDTFKTFHFPGRHYVVAWLKGFGVFGVRISYPMLINDSDDEEDSDEDEDSEDEAGASSSK
ncbi:hypothetical protein H4S00_002123 [Coemansia sp. D1744]|nr:hypothetical protein H4S00_002123 [Coemansia sp. D1744]